MARRPQIDTTNAYLGAENTFVDPADRDVEVVDRVISTDKLEAEAFMSEPVTIMVYESNDPNESDLVYTAVNGRTQYFARGVPQTVRRCYVELLARAKKTTYSQVLDDRLGEQMNSLQSHKALKYPFSVIEDKNPRGAEWLRNVLAQG